MRNSRQGALPSEIGWLIDELDDFASRLRTLESPSGESLGNALRRTVEGAVKPVPIFRLDSAPSITSVASAFATVSVPVPEGYTRAVVTVTASAAVRSNDAAGGWGNLTTAAIITPTPSGTIFTNLTTSVDGQKFGNNSAASAAVLEGLAPGDAVGVYALIAFVGSYTARSASVAGSVLFLH